VEGEEEAVVEAWVGVAAEAQTARRCRMPRGDGTGPPRGRAGRGARMRGTSAGAGPGGKCVCPQCGEKVSHQLGTPCYNVKCPRCGSAMIRE